MRLFSLMCCLVPCVADNGEGAKTGGAAASVKAPLAAEAPKAWSRGPAATSAALATNSSAQAALGTSDSVSMSVQRRYFNTGHASHTDAPAPALTPAALPKHRTCAPSLPLTEGVQLQSCPGRQFADPLSVAREGLEQLVMDLRFPPEERLSVASSHGPLGAGATAVDGSSGRSSSMNAGIAGRGASTASPSRSPPASVCGVVPLPARPLTCGTPEQRRCTQELLFLKHARRTDVGSGAGVGSRKPLAGKVVASSLTVGGYVSDGRHIAGDCHISGTCDVGDDRQRASSSSRAATKALPWPCIQSMQPRVGSEFAAPVPAVQPAAAAAPVRPDRRRASVGTDRPATGTPLGVSHSHPPRAARKVSNAAGPDVDTAAERAASESARIGSRMSSERFRLVPSAAPQACAPALDRKALKNPLEGTQIGLGAAFSKGSRRAVMDASSPVPAPSGLTMRGGSNPAAIVTASTPALVAAAEVPPAPLVSASAVSARCESSCESFVSVSLAGLGGACWDAHGTEHAYMGRTDSISDSVLLQPPVSEPPQVRAITGDSTGAKTFAAISEEAAAAAAASMAAARMPTCEGQPRSPVIDNAVGVPHASDEASASCLLRRSISVPAMDGRNELLGQGLGVGISKSSGSRCRGGVTRSAGIRGLIPASRPISILLRSSPCLPPPVSWRPTPEMLAAARRCNFSLAPSGGNVSGPIAGGTAAPVSIRRSYPRAVQHSGTRGGSKCRGGGGSIVLVSNGGVGIAGAALYGNGAGAAMMAGDGLGHLKLGNSSGSSGRYHQAHPRLLQAAAGPGATTGLGSNLAACGRSFHPSETAVELHGLGPASAGQRQPLYASKQVSQMALLPFLQLSNSNAFQPASSAPATCNLSALSREITGLRWIGQGGGGAVFQGVWQGSQVAVKFLLTEAGGRVDAAALEGVVSTVVNHPNVLHTYAFECTRLAEVSFNENDHVLGSIEGDGMELLESLIESCTTVSESLSIARRARLHGTAAGGGGLPQGAGASGGAIAGAANSATQRLSRLGFQSLLDEASVRSTSLMAPGSSDWSRGAASSSGAPEGSRDRGDSGGAGAQVLGPEISTAAPLSQTPDGSPFGGSFGPMAPPSGGGPIPFGPPSIIAHRPMIPTPDRCSPGHCDAAQLPQAFMLDLVGGQLPNSPVSPQPRTRWSQSLSPRAAAAAAAVQKTDVISVPSGGGSSGAAGRPGASRAGAFGAATNVAAATASAAAGSSQTTASANGPVSSGSAVNNVSGPWVGAARLNSTFHSDDGFGDPEASPGGQRWSVRQVMSYLRAKPGMYLTHIIMEYCDRGSLLSAIKRGLFREDSPWPEEEGCIAGFGRGDSTGTGGTGGGTEWTASSNAPRALMGSRNSALATAETLTQTGSAARRVLFRALLRTARDVAQGMSHLHANGIIHGDLKPGNVLLRSCRTDRRGFVAVVSDFGLSKVTRGEKPLDLNHWSTVTVMAPEVIMGTWLKASDIFSFGILLWQLVTGEIMPYGTCTVPQILVGVSQGTLKPAWPSTAHPALVRLGKACLATSPEKRPKFESIVKMLTKIEKDVRAKLQQAPSRRKSPSPESASTSTESGQGRWALRGTAVLPRGGGGGNTMAGGAGFSTLARSSRPFRRGVSVNDVRCLEAHWSGAAGNHNSVFAGGMGCGVGGTDGIGGEAGGEDEHLSVGTLAGCSLTPVASGRIVGAGDGGDACLVDCASTDGNLEPRLMMSPLKVQIL